MLKEQTEAGFTPPMAPFGYGDPTSTDIFKSAVHRFNLTGAIRHGAECFNYYFPQEMDSEYMVVWEGFDHVPFRYMTEVQVQQFLLARVPEGFSFPLNPKWLLCDKGWWEVFAALKASPEAQANMEAWYPSSANFQQRLSQLHDAYPAGFQQPPHSADEELDPELADYALERHKTWLRTKAKLKSLMAMRKMGGGKHADGPNAAGLAAAKRTATPGTLRKRVSSRVSRGISSGISRVSALLRNDVYF